jgi:hypothetical protein
VCGSARLKSVKSLVQLYVREVNKVNVFIYMGHNRILMQQVVMQHCMYIFFC